MEKIQKIYDEISYLEVEYSKLSWTLYTTGYDFGIDKAYEKLIEVIKNKENFNYIVNSRDKYQEKIDKRKIEILYKMLKPYHLSDELNELDMKIQRKVSELSKILNTFRYTFENKKVSSVDLTQILSTDNNRERRKEAYFAYCQINKPIVDGGFIELINLRKEYARLSGYEDYISYKLDENEQNKNTFDSWLNQFHEVLPKMKEIKRKYAKEFLNDDVIMPWDEYYINSKIAPSLNESVDMSCYYENISKFFKLFGIDISKYNITYDIFPRANKSEWGYNFPVETAKDSRILANVKNKYFEYEVLLHETGHAVHSFLLNSEENILNQGVSGIISEGIANLFGSFLYKNIFFKQFFIDEFKVENEFKLLNEYQKITSLKALNNIFFEHSLYKNDINNLEDIYKFYWDNYTLLNKEEPYSKETPWAHIIHFTTHPIYLHNYFMGDVTCEMLFKVFKQQYGVSVSEDPFKFGEFLFNEVIKPSGLYKYDELFKRISKNEFSLKYLID